MKLRRVHLAQLQAVFGDADQLVDLLTLAAIVVTPTETVEIHLTPTMTASSKPPRLPTST